jgi:hypothetical protein
VPPSRAALLGFTQARASGTTSRLQPKPAELPAEKEAAAHPRAVTERRELVLHRDQPVVEDAATDPEGSKGERAESRRATVCADPLPDTERRQESAHAPDVPHPFESGFSGDRDPAQPTRDDPVETDVDTEERLMGRYGSRCAQLSNPSRASPSL